MSVSERAKKELSQYVLWKKSADVIKSKVKELREYLEAINVSGRKEDRLLGVLAKVDKEEARLKEMLGKVERIDIALSALTEEEARVLRATYIDRKSIEYIITTENVCRSLAYEKKRKALSKFASVYFGVGEQGK